jgi:hypothetical protein
MAWRKRQGGKPDKNQEGLVKLGRRLGATIRITSLVGFGFPDFVLGFRGINLLGEVKRPDKIVVGLKTKPRKPTKTEQRQAAFRAEWTGQVAELSGPADMVALLTAADTVARVREGWTFNEAYQKAKDDMAAKIDRLVEQAFLDAIPGLGPRTESRPLLLPLADQGSRPADPAA